MADVVSKKHKAEPFPLSDPSVHLAVPNDDEHILAFASKRCRRIMLFSCVCATGATAIFAIAVLLCSFTIFKVKDPSLSMDSLFVDQFSIAIHPLASQPVTFNVSLAAEILISNPNIESLEFHASNTGILCNEDGQTVGIGYGPPGKVKARSATCVRVLIDLLPSHVDPQVLTNAVFNNGDVALTSRTMLSGRVSVLSLYWRDVAVAMNCSIILHMSRTEANVKITSCAAYMG